MSCCSNPTSNPFLLPQAIFQNLQTRCQNVKYVFSDRRCEQEEHDTNTGWRVQPHQENHADKNTGKKWKKQIKTNTGRCAKKNPLWEFAPGCTSHATVPHVVPNCHWWSPVALSHSEAASVFHRCGWCTSNDLTVCEVQHSKGGKMQNYTLSPIIMEVETGSLQY